MQLASRFAFRSPSLRSDYPLSDDQIHRVAPSIFADALHRAGLLSAPVGAAATQPALGQVFLGAVEHAPQVGAAVVEAARHQDLRFRDGRGLVGVVVLEGERGRRT